VGPQQGGGGAEVRGRRLCTQSRRGGGAGAGAQGSRVRDHDEEAELVRRQKRRDGEELVEAVATIIGGGGSGEGQLAGK
jgi:hypothetical protein